MATSYSERVCAKCNTPIPDDGTTCPNCGEFVDLPNMDDAAPAMDELEEFAQINFSTKKPRRPAAKLSLKDQKIIDRFLGRDKGNTLRLFR